MTQGNHRISEGNLTAVPALIRVAEARGLVPDQQVIAMDISKQRSVDRRLYGGTDTVPYYSFHSEILFFSVGGEVAGVEEESREEEQSWGT